MKFLDKESLFRYVVPLKGDLRLCLVFDLDFMGTGRIEKITEYIVIGKGDAFYPIKPLIMITPPKHFIGLSTIDDRRFFGNFLNGIFEQKRGYLQRISNILEQQIKSVLMEGKTYRKGGNEANRIWVRVPRRWKWLTDLLDSREDNGDDL